MYTSDIESKTILKTIFAYLVLTLFCALFGAVYEYFSHEVFSYFMLYAFGFPLIGGVLVYFLLLFFRLPLPGRLSLNLYNSGIAALTVGSIFQGILEIYGTTNRLIYVYWVIGALFLLTGIISYIMSLSAVSKKQNNDA
ncbi:MAG: hypothetical protein LUG66_06325 [Clostridiales bacterium]|nr:hypothetical protein [Clostridiales bacterium]